MTTTYKIKNKDKVRSSPLVNELLKIMDVYVEMAKDSLKKISK
jgi:hypothetical protein